MFIERDATNHPKVFRALQYLRDHAEQQGILVLDTEESQLMAEATGEGSGMKVRRHIILQLLTFQFITRDDSTSDWKIKLTQRGSDYLAAADKFGFFQKNVIEQLIFCDSHWAPQERAKTYADFNVKPYEIITSIMPQLGNKLYLEEMAYFVSKAKKPSDVAQILGLIKEYRSLTSEERSKLKTELQGVMLKPVKDKFGNWRKTNKRNFEVLSMGTELEMIITPDRAVDTFPLVVRTKKVIIPPSLIEHVKEIAEKNQKVEKQTAEKDPFDVDEEITRDELEFNSGLEGENIIASMLSQMGFKTRMVTGSNLGYDILALKENVKLLFEVKSSVNQCTITLTENEYETAKKYSKVYVLAVVENVFKNPEIFFIINPVEQLKEKIEPKNTKSFSIARGNWITVAQKSDSKESIASGKDDFPSKEEWF
jgi:hypothetical protein